MAYMNAFYAQSGGATSVINASAAGVIQGCQQSKDINRILVGQYGILGAIGENLIDMTDATAETLTALCHRPSSAFGSCRHKLKADMPNEEMERIFAVFAAHDIGYFFYNGGNDSQDTILKIARYADHINYPLRCIGIPKTIDNDLACTDHCPGYPSAAKFLATITQEIALELRGMSHSSTKVFVLEVMGRHAGWLAAACAYPAISADIAPHITLFPERKVDTDALIHRVDQSIQQYDHCLVVAAEGIRDSNGQMFGQSHTTDEFGHHQLGGAGLKLGNLLSKTLGVRYHCALPDYMQRASRHLAAAVDVEQAFQLGCAAVTRAIAGSNQVMLTIRRTQQQPYAWSIGETDLSSVANCEKCLPDSYIRSDGYGITSDFQQYLQPLITGEAYPPYKNGIPDYASIDTSCIEKIADKVSTC